MSARFDELIGIIARLRADGGCPWDREQTHASLKPNLLEETYEVLEAIDQDNPKRLREELGDLLLQILFHSQIASEEKQFSIDEVMRQLSDKLIRRHPHVFGALEEKDKPQNADEVLARWEVLKQEERQQRGQTGSPLDGVPKTLPALLYAFQLQTRASRVGFDWPEFRPVMEKFEEEWRELRQEWSAAAEAGSGEQHTRVEEELGDVLFALVNVARFLKANPEEALRKAIGRFTERFRYIEEQAARSGRPLQDLTLEEMDAWWDEAKKSGTGASSSSRTKS